MSKALNAVITLVNVPSDHPQKTADFYEKLLNIELAAALSDQEVYHTPISEDGIDLNVSSRHSPQEGVTTFFSVRDLDAVIATAKQMGAQVVWGPADLTIPAADFQAYKDGMQKVANIQVTTAHLCRGAILLEPGGTQVGLVQLEEHAHSHFKVGKFYRPLSDEQEKIHLEAMKIAGLRGRDKRPGRKHPGP